VLALSLILPGMLAGSVTPPTKSSLTVAGSAGVPLVSRPTNWREGVDEKVTLVRPVSASAITKCMSELDASRRCGSALSS
jgi:hypothetical protein